MKIFNLSKLFHSMTRCPADAGSRFPSGPAFVEHIGALTLAVGSEEDVEPPCGGIVSAKECLTPCKETAVCHSQPTETAVSSELALIKTQNFSTNTHYKGGGKNMNYISNANQAVCTRGFYEQALGQCRESDSTDRHLRTVPGCILKRGKLW